MKAKFPSVSPITEMLPWNDPERVRRVRATILLVCDHQVAPNIITIIKVILLIVENLGNQREKKKNPSRQVCLCLHVIARLANLLMWQRGGTLIMCSLGLKSCHSVLKEVIFQGPTVTPASCGGWWEFLGGPGCVISHLL